MFTTGRVCLKKAGRDAGKYCVVISDLEEGYVVVDGQTRRKKFNIQHLEPTEKVVEVKKDADSSTVKSALEKLGIQVKKGQPKEGAQRPKKQKIKREKPESKKTTKKSAEKKKE